MDAHDEHADDLVPHTTEQRIERAVQKLPTLSAHDVPLEDACPICLVSFSSVLAGDTVSAEEQGKELAGVTRLQGCGHMFCRLECVLLAFVI